MKLQTINSLIPGKACGYEKLAVNNTAGGTGLASIPTNANAAIVVVRKDATLSSSDDVIRINEFTTPTVTGSVGIPLDDKAVWEIKGYQNIQNFKAIATGAYTHNLYVQYYE